MLQAIADSLRLVGLKPFVRTNEREIIVRDPSDESIWKIKVTLVGKDAPAAQGWFAHRLLVRNLNETARNLELQEEVITDDSTLYDLQHAVATLKWRISEKLTPEQYLRDGRITERRDLRDGHLPPDDQGSAPITAPPKPIE